MYTDDEDVDMFFDASYNRIDFGSAERGGIRQGQGQGQLVRGKQRISHNKVSATSASTSAAKENIPSANHIKAKFRGDSDNNDVFINNSSSINVSNHGTSTIGGRGGGGLAKGNGVPKDILKWRKSMGLIKPEGIITYPNKDRSDPVFTKSNVVYLQDFPAWFHLRNEYLDQLYSISNLIDSAAMMNSDSIGEERLKKLIIPLFFAYRKISFKILEGFESITKADTIYSKKEYLYNPENLSALQTVKDYIASMAVSLDGIARPAVEVWLGVNPCLNPLLTSCRIDGVSASSDPNQTFSTRDALMKPSTEQDFNPFLSRSLLMRFDQEKLCQTQFNGTIMTIFKESVRNAENNEKTLKENILIERENNRLGKGNQYNNSGNPEGNSFYERETNRLINLNANHSGVSGGGGLNRPVTDGGYPRHPLSLSFNGREDKDRNNIIVNYDDDDDNLNGTKNRGMLSSPKAGASRSSSSSKFMNTTPVVPMGYSIANYSNRKGANNDDDDDRYGHEKLKFARIKLWFFWWQANLKIKVQRDIADRWNRNHLLGKVFRDGLQLYSWRCRKFRIIQQRQILILNKVVFSAWKKYSKFCLKLNSLHNRHNKRIAREHLYELRNLSKTCYNNRNFKKAQRKRTMEYCFKNILYNNILEKFFLKKRLQYKCEITFGDLHLRQICFAKWKRRCQIVFMMDRIDDMVDRNSLKYGFTKWRFVTTGKMEDPSMTEYLKEKIQKFSDETKIGDYTISERLEMLRERFEEFKEDVTRLFAKNARIGPKI